MRGLAVCTALTGGEPYNATGSPLELRDRDGMGGVLNTSKKRRVRIMGKLKTLPEIKWQRPRHLEVK